MFSYPEVATRMKGIITFLNINLYSNEFHLPFKYSLNDNAESISSIKFSNSSNFSKLYYGAM